MGRCVSVTVRRQAPQVNRRRPYHRPYHRPCHWPCPAAPRSTARGPRTGARRIAGYRGVRRVLHHARHTHTPSATRAAPEAKRAGRPSSAGRVRRAASGPDFRTAAREGAARGLTAARPAAEARRRSTSTCEDAATASPASPPRCWSYGLRAPVRGQRTAAPASARLEASWRQQDSRTLQGDAPRARRGARPRGRIARRLVARGPP